MVLNGLIVIPMFTYLIVFLAFPLFTPDATPPDLVRLEMLSLFMTMASYACFVKAIRSPTFTNAFVRTAIENNWFSPEESDFYREFVRYRETFGVQGQFRGDVRWAVGYWALAMAFITASAPVVLVLHPYLGGWAWVPLAVVVMPTSIYCWVAYARRTRAQYVRAETEGFPLAEGKTRNTPRVGNAAYLATPSTRWLGRIQLLGFVEIPRRADEALCP
ncbi:MAG: hypothetical protein E6K17_09160 [Methanobacteriota archaeon]|nr:MAG: hypothetical protein E6K17_09160 [Euryarchaeota archaeon]